MSNSCSECEEAIHVFYVKKGDEKLKLLEQAHCAKCWRPLHFDSNWPGSRESLRPPFHSPGQPLRLSVAQCGHVFHNPCLNSETHCPACFVWLHKVKPFHYHKATGQQLPPEMDFPVLEEVQQSRLKSEAEIADLKLKIDHLTSEVERLQRQLDRKPYINSRWH